MTGHRTTFSLAALLYTCAFCGGQAAAQVPDAIAAPGETTLATLHAEGAQVYECKAGTDGKLAWAFREPVASLFVDGKTVGRHYAGPNWDHVDGSGVTAKAAGNAPAKSANDIPWLKLQVTDAAATGYWRGRRPFNGSIPRAACSAGHATRRAHFMPRPTAPDYVFLGRAN